MPHGLIKFSFWPTSLLQQPAFMPLVIKQLEKSLDDAVYCYLFNYLQNGKMPIVHPWLRTALEELTPRRLAG